MSSYTYTSKFFSLSPYLLAEYRYGVEPNPEFYPTNFGLNNVGFEKIVNGYLNGAVQITNRDNDRAITGNVRDISSVQTAPSTFVRLDIDRLVQYLDYDNKLTAVSNLPISFESNLNIYYDSIRYHFLSGYDFGTNDGVILQVQFPERTGKKATVSQITYEKGDIDIVQANANPIYFNAGIYDRFIEVKIPSYYSMTYDYDTQINSPVLSQTLGAKISSDGKGFIRNQPFTVALYEITSTDEINDFFYYRTQLFSTASVTPFDEFGDLAANIIENTDFDYLQYFPSWKGNFIEDFIFLENSLGNNYYIVHDIELREQIGVRQIVSQRFQSIQDQDFNSPYIYRPIVLNPRATSFTVFYSMRMVNRSSNVSMLRTASFTSTEVDKYGRGLKRIKLNNEPYPQKVYNKIVEPTLTKAYNININPIERVITKYVPAFFERENVNISQEDLIVDSLGGVSQSSTSDATVAYGQGKAKIVINPYDNYYKFRIFTKNVGKENTVLDLGNSTEFYIVFEGGENRTIKIASLYSSSFQNPSKGELVFRVVESDSKKISAFSARDFHIVCKTSNGIETSIYHGTWIIPSERETQTTTPASSDTTTTVTPTPTPPVVQIAPVTTAPVNPVTVNVVPQTPADFFDPKKDQIAISVEPRVTPEVKITIEKPEIKKPVKKSENDINSLANSITADEQAGKTVKQISDYYTIPGSPGNSLYEKMNSTFFLNAVRLVHPDVNGKRSSKFLEYSTYLKVIYKPYEENKYPRGGGGSGITRDMISLLEEDRRGPQRPETQIYL
jgi:hypothetical protein